MSNAKKGADSMTSEANTGAIIGGLIWGCLAGLKLGGFLEQRIHREACACKFCINWRKKRDADKELEQAK